MPLPVYSICISYKVGYEDPVWFIMSKRSADLAPDFLRFEGKLVSFETQTDAQTFCALLNSSYLTETFKLTSHNNRLN